MFAKIIQYDSSFWYCTRYCIYVLCQFKFAAKVGIFSNPFKFVITKSRWPRKPLMLLGRLKLAEIKKHDLLLYWVIMCKNPSCTSKHMVGHFKRIKNRYLIRFYFNNQLRLSIFQWFLKLFKESMLFFLLKILNILYNSFQLNLSNMFQDQNFKKYRWTSIFGTCLYVG